MINEKNRIKYLNDESKKSMSLFDKFFNFYKLNNPNMEAYEPKLVNPNGI